MLPSIAVIFTNTDILLEEQKMLSKNDMSVLGFFALLAVLICASPRAGAQVLRYTFDEASSGTTAALDSGTPPAANGSFVGAATRVPGMGGSLGALDLSANDGLGNWMTAGDADKLDAMSGVTISMWVNLRGNTTNTAMLASDATPFQSGWSFEIGGATPSASHFSIEIWMPGSGTGHSSTTAIDADHKWVMLAGTFDNSSHVIQVYAGSPTSAMMARGSLSAAPGCTLGANAAEFQVGNQVFSPTENFKIPAWIDNVRVYNRALSLSELEAIRVSEVPEPSTAALCAAGIAVFLAWRWRVRGKREQ
jgi:hypothetical protein